MIRNNVVGFFVVCLFTTSVSNAGTPIGYTSIDTKNQEVSEVVVEQRNVGDLSISDALSNVGGGIVLDVSTLDLNRERASELDFTNQLVTFDVNDYEEPIVYDDCHVTAYCNCEVCCGEYAWKYTTSTGTEAIEGITVAVDPRVIPYGSIIELDGHFYIAQDCGGGINGIEIDVYVDDVGGSHKRCYQFMYNLGQDYGNTIRVWIPK